MLDVEQDMREEVEAVAEALHQPDALGRICMPALGN
jgi:hypothetical protein